MPDFLFSLPLLNPCVRGDGVGYDVLPVRPLIEHSSLHDYPYANPSFRDQRNNVTCRVLAISSTELEESKVARSRRPAPTDLGEELR